MRGERVKVGKTCILAREGDQSEHGEERVDSTIKADSKEEREGKQEEPP